jgi:diguanylate cyclase (GGDEF)-like protein
MNVSRYKCSVLVVDDESKVLAVLAAQLAGEFEVLTAPTAARARAVLAECSVDIVVSDLQLPDESGLGLLDWVRRTAPRTARVLLTGASNLDFAVDAINQCQVHRLVLKPWRREDLLHALHTVSRVLVLERSHEQILDQLRRLNLELEQRIHTRTLELEQALLQVQQKNLLLEKMAATDPLTGLPNRRAIDRIARTELLRRARTPAPIALLMVDADYFGRINKQYSQTAGDHVLVWLSNLLQSSVRGSDCVGRVGGEEFLVVAPNTDPVGAEVLAERLRASVAAARTVYNGYDLALTISIGIAVADATAPVSYEQLRETAADALKEAKDAGRNRAVLRPLELPVA